MARTPRSAFALAALTVFAAAALGVSAFAVYAARGAAPASRWATASVDRGPVVVTIAGIGTVEGGDSAGRALVTLIPDADLERVKPGQPVRVAVDAYPNRDLHASVTSVRPGPAGTARALVTLDATEPALAGGDSAWVRIEVERRDNALRVPYAALLFQPGGPEPAPTVSAADRKAFAGQALAQFIEHVKRDVGFDPAQCAEADRIARELGDAVALGLGPEADPATRRERVHAMRRTFIKRLAGVVRPEQQARFDAVVAARAKRAGRDTGQAGRIHILTDRGDIEPVAVRIGAMDGLHTEVLGAPIEAGARVVIGEARRDGSRLAFAETLRAWLPRARP
ncbi:HlyD family secretion protein [Alsobacter sp. SYSU M60028]|uniref:HlyD family secretion protein n=1 Tax=Alsobacter ponti TaxID=2962936 RepID=A0ABT1LDD4_9HYPH|nr:HlyD family efflux transporter periplasmic adaptor subunit [Alsobacter ponti]MCP8938903.1 HlyD family secretion protein [Alsobacter ponti]